MESIHVDRAKECMKGWLKPYTTKNNVLCLSNTDGIHGVEGWIRPTLLYCSLTTQWIQRDSNGWWKSYSIMAKCSYFVTIEYICHKKIYKSFRKRMITMYWNSQWSVFSSFIQWFIIKKIESIFDKSHILFLFYNFDIILIYDKHLIILLIILIIMYIMIMMRICYLSN